LVTLAVLAIGVAEIAFVSVATWQRSKKGKAVAATTEKLAPRPGKGWPPSEEQIAYLLQEIYEVRLSDIAANSKARSNVLNFITIWRRYPRFNPPSSRA
jgi:hypothetical protein